MEYLPPAVIFLEVADRLAANEQGKSVGSIIGEFILSSYKCDIMNIIAFEMSVDHLTKTLLSTDGYDFD